MKKISFIVIVLTLCVFGQNFPPTTPWNGKVSVSDLPLPGYLETLFDSSYNVSITRISDEKVFNNTSVYLQSSYSKVQAWNADMSMIKLGLSNYILDGTTYQLIKKIGGAKGDGRWSHVDPNIIYFGVGDRLKTINVMTEKETTLHTFPGYGSGGHLTIGPWEGNITMDDSLVVVTSSDEKKASVYDIKNDVIISSKEFPETFDWVSMTPWGDYVVATERGSGKTVLYDLQFNFIRTLYNDTPHADFGIDTDGNEVLVGMCPLRMVQLDNGQETDLLPATEYTKGICGMNRYNPWVCGHVSGRNFDRPGWAYISAGIDDCNNGYDGYYNYLDLFALKLDGSGIVQRYGHTRTDYSEYLNEARAVVSPDGQKIIFNSHWQQEDWNGETVYAFVVEAEELPAAVSEKKDNNTPEHVVLAQNVPNPFNHETLIRFQLSHNSVVTVKIYNIVGEHVRTIMDDHKNAGAHVVHWDGRDSAGSYVPSGIYFYQIRVGNFLKFKKMVFCK